MWSNYDIPHQGTLKNDLENSGFAILSPLNMTQKLVEKTP